MLLNGRMIIATDTPFTIGERKTGPLADKNRKYHTMTFVVLREATEAEYRQSALDHGASEHDAYAPFKAPHRFYAIATD